MIISEKQDAYKPLFNYDHSTVVQETLDWNYDVRQAVCYALRKMGKKSNVYEKTVYIPLVNLQRYYNIDLSLLTRESIDFVQATSFALVYTADDGEDYYCKANTQHLPQIERLERTDLFRLAKRLFGASLDFKTNMQLETVPAGTFEEIKTLVGTSLETVGTTPAVGDIITNLDRSDQGEWYYDVATTAANPTTMETDVSAAPYNWSAGDKIYISTGRPIFLILTFRAIPQMGYFTANSDTIPCQAQFIDDIDSFAVTYLYSLLMARDPESVRGLEALRQSGLLLTEDEMLKDIKRRTRSFKTVTTKSYLPVSVIKYGR